MNWVLAKDVARSIVSDSDNRSFETGDRVRDLADASVDCCNLQGVATIAVTLAVQTNVVCAKGAYARKVGCSLEECVESSTEDAWLRFHSLSLSANLRLAM